MVLFTMLIHPHPVNVIITHSLKKFPECFLKQEIPSNTPSKPLQIHQIKSDYDITVKGRGNFLFGGLLNKCRIISLLGGYTSGLSLLNHSMLDPNAISSEPYELCFCTENMRMAPHFICIKNRNITIYSGQTFNVSLMAIAQIGTTSTTITAITSSSTRIEPYQTTQYIENGCNELQYTMYSTKDYEEIKLYADGPCRDTGDAFVVVRGTILPCPDGFTKTNDICSCGEKLHKYSITCNVPYFTKNKNANFWMGALYIDEVYVGLILASSCPLEYCKSESHKFTLNDLDSQCDQNRAGLVCGACAANYSLMLGGSYCQVCSNSYLALILPFAIMGITLVAFMIFLRITVATSIFNSIILYCNILQTIRNSLLPSNRSNVLTVFLAWMNLDFGFQTCFYNGLDSYMQTWLQFIFPLYLWFLIGAIIFISRRSITVSKLIGRNPIAVLATLILMSYMKILKNIVDVFAFLKLDYSDDSTVTVWLKDANVPYLQSQHLVLTIVTTIVLVFFFLPYTILLLLGHKLYRFTGRKYFRWFNKVKPLLDSYYAPYKIKTRFWTGFLLTVRCAVYIMFLQFSQSTNKMFMAINIICSILGFILGIFYAGKIYKKVIDNFAEAFIYLNLLVLSASALAGLNSEPLVLSLVASVFIFLLCTCAYQFHLLYIAKMAVWLKIKDIALASKQKTQRLPRPGSVDRNSSKDPYKFVTKTVIELH